MDHQSALEWITGGMDHCVRQLLLNVRCCCCSCRATLLVAAPVPRRLRLVLLLHSGTRGDTFYPVNFLQFIYFPLPFRVWMISLDVLENIRKTKVFRRWKWRRLLGSLTKTIIFINNKYLFQYQDCGGNLLFLLSTSFLFFSFKRSTSLSRQHRLVRPHPVGGATGALEGGGRRRRRELDYS